MTDEVRIIRFYRCEECGREFTSYGIGPHQAGLHHSGKTDLGKREAPALSNESLRMRDKRLKARQGIRGGVTGTIRRTPDEIRSGVSLDELKARARRFAQAKPRKDIVEYQRPDEMGLTAGPGATSAWEKRKATIEAKVVKQPGNITRVPNMEVVTDGERIGIVEWHTP